jgi:hypothetical protein
MKMTESIEFKDLKETSLGQPFERKDLKHCCKAIYAGVAWPGKRPGFAVVIAMDKEEHFDNHDICLLDEYESFDTRELVRQCGVLDHKYQPQRWIGDSRNNAADRFIREMNSELESREDSQARIVGATERRRRFNVCSTQMLNMEQLYPYILPHIKSLLDKDRRQLFVKDSSVLNYLSAVEPSEIATLEFGDFPAVEALAFAVLEMRVFGQRSDDDDEEGDMAMARSYAPKSVFV